MKTIRSTNPSRIRRLILAAVAAGTLAGGIAAVPSVAGAGAPADKGIEVPCNQLPDGCVADPDPDPVGPTVCEDEAQICDLTTPTTDPDEPPPVDPTPEPGSDVVKVSPRFTG